MLSSAILNVLMFVATEEETLKTCLEKSKVDVAVACVNGLDTKTLAASTKESLNNLSPEVFSRLSAATQEALGKAPGATEGDTAAATMLSDRNAIRPSLRVVGDAFGRVSPGNGEDDDASTSADASFGGGLDVRTLNIRASLMIKKGTQPREISGEGAFGTAILLPQTENFSVSTDFTWFPDWYAVHCNIRKKKADRWCAGSSVPVNKAYRDSWAYQLRRNILVGPSLLADVARTQWKHTLPAVEGMDGLVTAPEASVTGQATTFHAALGLRYSWIRSLGDNWVEVSLFAGGSWRGVRVDSGANKALVKLWEDPASMRGADSPGYADRGNFLKSALGTDRKDFFGADISLSVRVNDVVITAMLPYVAGHDVSGLDGFRLIPMLSFRTGFELVKLATEAKAAK